MIESVKDAIRLLKAPVYAAKTLGVVGPADDSDDAVWEYVKHNISGSWHMSGTIRMGNDPESAWVDLN